MTDLHGLVALVERTASRTVAQAVRSLVMAVVAVVALVVGLGFLTVAGFLAIAQAKGTIIACLAVGVIYLVVAAVILLLLTRPAGRARTARPAMMAGAVPPATPPHSAASDMTEAFVTGMEVGQSFGRGFHRAR